MDEKLENLKSRLLDIETRLRSAEKKLERYEYLISQSNLPYPVLKSSEDEFIRRLGGLSRTPLSDSGNLSAFKESALRLIGMAAGRELPAQVRKRTAVIEKFLLSGKIPSIRNLLYITTQLIIVLTSCAGQLSEQEQKSIINELEVLIEIESLELP